MKINELFIGDLLTEAVANMGDAAIRNEAAKTKVRYFHSQNRDRSVLVITGQVYTYTSGSSSVKMTKSEWQKFELGLIGSGYTEEKNKKHIYKWLPFIKSVLKWASIAVVSGIVIAAIIIQASGTVPLATVPLVARQLGLGKVFDYITGKFRTDVDNGAFVLREEL